MSRRLQTVMACGVAALLSCALAEPIPPARPSGHIYVEAEECFCLEDPQAELEGYLGSGQRRVRQTHGRDSLDKTLAVRGNPAGVGEYVVWVRAYVDGGDRRVSVAWLGEQNGNQCVQLEPTHARRSGASGFVWERAGVVPVWRRFHQFRLLPVGESDPIVDAFLITSRQDYVPPDELSPRDDPALTGGDGEGTTSIRPVRVVAGETAEVAVTYEVGSSGLGPGAALRFFVNQTWSLPQTSDPEGAGFLTIESSRPGVRLQIDCHRPGRGARNYSGELRHQHEVLARVVTGRLQGGDTVTVHYRGETQPHVQAADDFRNVARAWYSPALPFGMWTDVDGDGDFWPVAPERSHRLAVVAGQAASFHVVVPSVLQVGESISLRIAALDARRNPADGYEGTLTVELLDLETGARVPEQTATIALGPEQHGWRHVRDALRSPQVGVFAVRVRDADGREALSNPMECTAADPAYRIYWGDLHTHHRRCDGLRRFAEAAAHARDIAGLDIVSLSPHACYITEGDLHDLWHVDVQFNAPGRFLTLFSYEWAAGGRGASHSVLYSRSPIAMAFRAFGGGHVVRGRPALYALLEEHDLDVIEVPHHVGGITDRHPRYQKAIEVYSQHESREAGVIANLNDGLQATLFGTSDNHSGHPGLQPLLSRFNVLDHYGGLTAFLVPELTREALFEAIEERRTYATADCRVIARLRVNGEPMGRELLLDSPAVPRRIAVEAFASQPIAGIDLLRNGRQLRTWQPERCVVRLETVDDAPHGGPLDYYYVRVRRAAGHTAFLTPVWVRYRNPVMSPGQRFRLALEELPNLARGKTVTVSFPDGITAGRVELLTDGKLNAHLGHGVEGRVWAQVDLGSVQTLGAVRLWNYFRDGRTYSGNRLELSATGAFEGEQTVVFDSDRDGEYAESAAGRLFLFEPVRARHIRSWLNGSTSNPGSQWLELEAYPPLPDRP